MVSLEEEMRELKLTRDALLMKHEQQDMASLKKPQEELKQEKISLLIENRCKQQQVDCLKKSINELTSEKKALLIQGQRKQQQVDSLKKSISELANENAALLIQRQCKQQQVDSLKISINELTSEKTALLIQRQCKQQQVDSLKKSIDKSEKKALLIQGQRKQQQVDSLKKSISELAIENEALLIQRQLEQEEIYSLAAQLNMKETINRSLAREILCWKKGLEHWTVEQESSAAALCQHITEKMNTFDLEKQSALDNCQKTFVEQFNDKLHKLEQWLISTRAKIDHNKLLHAKACDERTAQQAELTCTALVKEILEKVSQGRRERQLARLQTEDNPEHRQKEHEGDVQE